MDILDLRRKADSGSVSAQSILGICYLEGVGVEPNYREAFRYLSSAASQNVPRAMHALARMYTEGLGTEIDMAKAISLYESAAEAGEFLSQIELARIFSRGMGIQIDIEKASHWYSAAIAQRDLVQDCAELQEAKNYISQAGK